MNFTYPKPKKKQNHDWIIVTEGKSVSKYPLRLYMGRTKEKIKMGVWFPKKNFKKAVDRNYFKRVLRETYRLNKHLPLTI
jgi:ribonuclease P protein component